MKLVNSSVENRLLFVGVLVIGSDVVFSSEAFAVV